MQRKAKTYRAAMPGEGNITLSKLKDFALEAQKLLEDAGEEDAAFYFDQLADHLIKNPEKGLDEKASRILGV